MQPLGIGRFRRSDLFVRGVAHGFVEIARGELEGLEHLLRMLVDDRKIAAQAVMGVVEMLLIGDCRGHEVERDRKHDRANQQDSQRPAGASRRVRRCVQKASCIGQSEEELTHWNEGSRPHHGGTGTLR